MTKTESKFINTGRENVCTWIDEHPEYRIISITAINTSCYIIFYQYDDIN